jgi:hypothetical protein
VGNPETSELEKTPEKPWWPGFLRSCPDLLRLTGRRKRLGSESIPPVNLRGKVKEIAYGGNSGGPESDLQLSAGFLEHGEKLD